MKPVPALATALVLLVALNRPAFAAATPSTSTPAQPRPDVVAAALQPFVDDGTLAGAVLLVASKDQVLGLESVGYADVAAKTPMRNDSLFWIASMSKPMTAIALMMLVDEGKVGLDDPVEKYLPEFHGQMVLVHWDDDVVVLKKAAHPIVVRELLSHTAGLPFMSRVEERTHHIDTMPLRDAVLTYALSPLKFQPGTRYDYSNAGLNTVGRLVEVVSGVPYERFMQERLFDPLGMKDTSFTLNDEQAHRLAKSYRPGAGNIGFQEIPIEQLTYPLARADRYPSPAGGLFSTAGDVAHFGQMILNGGTIGGKRYVSESAVRQMTSTQTPGGGDAGYGLGWQTTRRSRGDVGPAPGARAGHGGAYATNLTVDPEHGLVTVFMVQHAGYPGPNGGKVLPAFEQAAVAAFGAK